MDTLMTTVPAVGAVARANQCIWTIAQNGEALILPHSWLPAVMALLPHRATAGRPYRWKTLRW